MRFDLNLAKRPFVNMTLPAAIALALALGIVAFTAFNATILFASPGETGAKDYQERIDEALANLERMESEISGIEEQLNSNEAKLLGGRIKFANELIARQKLNWTRLFDRLEALTPAKVRMLRISPLVQGDKVNLVLRVEESEPNAVLDFVKALEDSPAFSRVSIEDESPSKVESGQIWRLRVSYLNK